MILDRDAQRDHAARLLRALGGITDGLRGVGLALEMGADPIASGRVLELLKAVGRARREPRPPLLLRRPGPRFGV